MRPSPPDPAGAAGQPSNEAIDEEVIVGLLKTAATVAVASSVHGRIQRRQQNRWAAQDAAAMPAPPPAQYAAPAHPPHAHAAPAPPQAPASQPQPADMNER